MKVYTHLPDNSSAEAEICIQYNGTDMEISFNYFHILDFYAICMMKMSL